MDIYIRHNLWSFPEFEANEGRRLFKQLRAVKTFLRLCLQKCPTTFAVSALFYKFQTLKRDYLKLLLPLSLRLAPKERTPRKLFVLGVAC